MADHAVRAMSSFPMAENYYYGIPYHQRAGRNDLRRYENIIVPTSYMVCDTKYDFFGGYDNKTKGGFIHVANRHIAPGKKQWTWGSEEFGKAWDRELTDVNGPYFELMSGVYTDNQPDFSYLLPFETKTFSQYWWSYQRIGSVQNANKQVAIKLEPRQGNKVVLGVASSRRLRNLTILLRIGPKTEKIENVTVSPDQPWSSERSIESGDEDQLWLWVVNEHGTTLLVYHHKEIDNSRHRPLANEPKQPEELKSSIALEMIGEHLMLYRHPTRYPEPYWKEAVKQDPQNYNAYISLCKAAIKNGILEEAKNYAAQAIAVLTTYHPNPSKGEAHYYHGLACLQLGEIELAYQSFYKATWNYEWRSASYYMLAKLDARMMDFETAIEHLDAATVTNTQNNSAIILKAMILNELDQKAAAERILQKLLEIDPLDQWANFELGTIRDEFSHFLSSSRNDAQTVIDIAFEYIESGFFQRAIAVIELHIASPEIDCAVPNPMGRSNMTELILVWLYFHTDQRAKGNQLMDRVNNKSFDYFFPSRLAELQLLEWIDHHIPHCTMAAYGLGNFYYNAKRHQDAIKIWEKALDAGCQYATLYRNLGIAYWNVNQDGDSARYYFEKSIMLSPKDMRIQFEYDQLRKKLNDSPEERLKHVLTLAGAVFERDDFRVELAALYNYTDQSEKALDLLTNGIFHPWEGGEGQVLKQFTYACLHLGQDALRNNNATEALAFFERAQDTPNNLGEKYHPLQAVAHINYWKGLANQALGFKSEALEYFRLSAEEKGDFINMAVSDFSEMTYYQALSLKEMGNKPEAVKVLKEMKVYASEKLMQKAKIDYFATSLPLLLVFEDDIQKRNDIEAYYLLGLAEFGLENYEQGATYFKRILELNIAHIGAKDHLQHIANRYN